GWSHATRAASKGSRPRPARKGSTPTEAPLASIGSAHRGGTRPQGRRLRALHPQELAPVPPPRAATRSTAVAQGRRRPLAGRGQDGLGFPFEKRTILPL
ncbi:hypothetical protein GW17_00042419, partial [Ensete ventricosum]